VTSLVVVRAYILVTSLAPKAPRGYPFFDLTCPRVHLYHSATQRLYHQDMSSHLTSITLKRPARHHTTFSTGIAIIQSVTTQHYTMKTLHDYSSTICTLISFKYPSNLQDVKIEYSSSWSRTHFVTTQMCSKMAVPSSSVWVADHIDVKA
jgi:hypothetical protein